jgi:hypothetical protein
MGSSACSDDDSSNDPTSSESAGGATDRTPESSATADAGSPASGTVVLSLGSATSTLAVQLCVQTPAGGMNLTAIGADTPAPTLVVNLAGEMSGSTLVYTTTNTDNSFTTHSMAPSDSTEGSLDGLRVRIAGTAVEQAYTPQGEAAGDARSEPVTVDAVCQAIQQPNPAPQYGTTVTSEDESSD